MTYCYAFNISPDGIGIISDTRLSRITTFGDIEYNQTAYQKVYCPTNNSFVAFAGTIDHLASLFSGLGTYLLNTDERFRYESFLTFIKNRYGELWSNCYFNDLNFPSMAILYGDIRHHRGKTKCRLFKFDFGFVSNKASIGIRKVDTGEWAAIGWTSEGRKILSNSASDVLGELESRSLIIRDPNKEEINRYIKNHGPIKENAKMTIMDSSGERDSSFRKTLRNHTNDLPNASPLLMQFDPVLMFSAAAQKEIQIKMNELRLKLFDFHETVSDSWSIANVTRRNGFRIFSDEDLWIIKNLYGSIVS